ncbi:hypothetical protein SAMN02745753_03492 [Marinomonas polaris DSM 16579]|uniref:Uncharacterized protein n=1 Tax=Marinomonas polaris DSM 16579 TaxID=1122206 RepID=A0A1M5I2X9_9GAMM|nr:hypothetical protein [Marinomonas polaris]SHG22648.1 hypothetical protein SAMN02745753_03492 [Marinomonas polaris DSM 16579]
MDKQLKPEYQDLADEFDIDYKDRGCHCHINPPCGYCVHPGHPENLEETPEAWEQTKSSCPTLGSTCRGCPDCQSLPVGDDATNEALRLEMENDNG